MMKQLLLQSMAKNCLTTILLLVGYSSIGQISINGSRCVIPGITYEYSVNARRDSLTSMSICITGGKLKDGTACSPAGVITNFVFVVWDSAGNHQIKVTSSSGTANLSVNITTELNGGQINEADRFQFYDKNKAIHMFQCKEASGGSCSASNLYQWQQSDDGFKWTFIGRASDKDLKFSGKIIASIFFRRVVTEMRSHTVAYSDIAMLTLAE
jgi:hypothetical protein